MATDAIDEGKVKLRGQNIKPSKTVSLGDRFEIKADARKWIIEVTGIIANRVGFDVAVLNYVDLTPEEEKIPHKILESGFYTGKRISKTGKPTKKQRRSMDDFLNEFED